MNVAGYLICGLILICTVLFAGLRIETARNDTLTASLSASQADVARLQSAETERTRLQSEIARIDLEHTTALRAALDENDSLRRAVADGSRRLSVRATCPRLPEAATAASVGDAASPELTPDARSAYFDHRAGIETVNKQLAACQSYAAAVSLNPTLQGGRK